MQIWLHANLFRFLLSKLFWLLVGVLAMPVKIRRCSKCIWASFPKGFCGCALNYFISVNLKKSNISSPNFFILFIWTCRLIETSKEKFCRSSQFHVKWRSDSKRDRVESLELSRSSRVRVFPERRLESRLGRVATWLGQSPAHSCFLCVLHCAANVITRISSRSKCFPNANICKHHSCSDKA